MECFGPTSNAEELSMRSLETGLGLGSFEVLLNFAKKWEFDFLLDCREFQSGQIVENYQAADDFFVFFVQG